MDETSALLRPIGRTTETTVEVDMDVTGELKASVWIVDGTIFSETSQRPVLLSDELMLIKWFQYTSILPVPIFSLPVTPTHARLWYVEE